MRISLDGRRVVVTGGTRGVGRATSLVMSRAGATVLAVYRADDAAAARIVEALGWAPERNSVLRADLRTPEGRAHLVAACRERLGGVDVLVNNLGTYGPRPLAEATPGDVEETLSANLSTHILVTQAVLPLLADGASVVNVGAGMADRGRPGHAAFTAAKAGLYGFTRSLAKELGTRGIRVNTVAPGVVETERAMPLPEAERELLTQVIPLRRFSTAADVASLVTFLASDLSSFVNGAAVGVDGGL
jgi:NAD(P)-dependent dehydrogenase (short-subunit alcohol dehydrogenase family)